MFQQLLANKHHTLRDSNLGETEFGSGHWQNEKIMNTNMNRDRRPMAARLKNE